MRTVISLILLLLAFGLVACGQKGPLVLPPEPTPAQSESSTSQLKVTALEPATLASVTLHRAS